ncbi:hypothetical protein DBA20_13245 [Pandoraea capi]|uniref:Uncharacterized protein n=1 Tax=Pandoraea capi TaxID=2508286 RepID=A0ABY6W305_9BURK|nr:hypothetical protein [Pandoraea sp. LA3]MDN4583949.1 hypothetical protein [Pandoraea capi]ODP34131.1 hypothetical protein A9762_03430 [Pandoraea sp. ISTKB]VVE16906.1 hypothetical protein PCA20602_02936 [Pandoraea capi]
MRNVDAARDEPTPRVSHSVKRENQGKTMPAGGDAGRGGVNEGGKHTRLENILHRSKFYK